MRGSRPVIISRQQVGWAVVAACCVSLSASAAEPVPCPFSTLSWPLSAENSIEGKGVTLFREANELSKTNCLGAAHRFLESAKYLFVEKADVAKFVFDPTEQLKADRLFVYQQAWGCFVRAGQTTMGRKELAAAAKGDPALAKELTALIKPKRR